MAVDYASLVQTVENPPTVKARSDQVPNSTGGHVFALDDWSRLDRFLILGSEGTYYAGVKPATKDNVGILDRCLAEDSCRTIRRIIEISVTARAPKQDPAIFALAYATIRYAQDVLALKATHAVCRTGSHILQFVSQATKLRGIGTTLKRIVQDWYDSRDVAELAFQVTKYRSRGDWSHRDVLRKFRPTGGDRKKDATYRWIVGGLEGLGERDLFRGERKVHYSGYSLDDLPETIQLFEKVKATKNKEELLSLFTCHSIPREYLEGSHSEHLNDPEIWSAMLPTMPLTAMVRNLGKMSTIGLLKPFSKAVDLIVSKLSDDEYIRKSRIHPFAVLVAMRTYGSGSGIRGALQWQANQDVLHALDKAFYLSFQNIVPAGKRTLIALDVSCSMWMSLLPSSPSLSAREASAAFAMTLVRTEPKTHVVGFMHSLVDLPITKGMSLREAVQAVSDLPFGSTNIALPIQDALEKGIEVDTFVIVTDNEVNCGSKHPFQALTKYRNKMGIPAKLVVVGMTSTGFSVADPNDAGSLDVVGFDAAAPALIADFSRGEF